MSYNYHKKNIIKNVNSKSITAKYVYTIPNIYAA